MGFVVALAFYISKNLHYLLRLVCYQPDWFLDEMLDLLDNNRLGRCLPPHHLLQACLSGHFLQTAKEYY